MGVGERGLVLHAQPGQGLDVEEPPVGQFLRAGAPVREPEVLLPEQLVERVRIVVHGVDLGVDRLGDLGVGPAQVGEAGPQHLLVPVPLDHRRPVGAAAVRQPAERDRQALQLLGPGPGSGLAEQPAEGARRDRRLMLVVVHGERAALPLQHQLAGLQDPAVLVAEHRHQHGGRQLALRRVPVDVEVAGVHARRPVLQHVPPPGVGPPGQRHVVGHDVEHLTEVVAGQLCGEPAVAVGAAELAVQPAVVDDVVAVGAAGRGLQHRRAVQVADAKLGQVAGDGRGVVEGEARVQLHPVGGGPRAGTRPRARARAGARRRRGHHAGSRG